MGNKDLVSQIPGFRVLIVDQCFSSLRCKCRGWMPLFQSVSAEAALREVTPIFNYFCFDLMFRNNYIYVRMLKPTIQTQEKTHAEKSPETLLSFQPQAILWHRDALQR